MHLKHFVFILILLIILLSGCGSDKKEEKNAPLPKEKVLQGEWKAQWVKSNPEDGFTGKQLKMDGKMKFTEKRVEITVNGFDGCVFFTDTTTNRLKWKLEDNVIRFVDLSDDQGLPYNIESFSQDKIELSLMEDIYITLDKVN